MSPNDSIVGLAIGDSDSFELCSSFGCNTYTITLVDIVNLGDGTVEVTVDRTRSEGANAVATVTLTIEVQTALGAVTIYEDSSEWASGTFTVTASGAGQENDQVTVTAETDNFGGGFAQVQGVVPAAFDPALVSVTSCAGVTNQANPGGEATATFSVGNENDAEAEARVNCDSLSGVEFTVVSVDGNVGNVITIPANTSNESGHTATFQIPSDLATGTYEIEAFLDNIAVRTAAPAALGNRRW